MSSEKHAALLALPAGWVFVGWTLDVMTNCDRAVDDDVVAQLRRGGCYAAHSALNFHGLVWFDDGRWHERVSVDNEPRASFSADTVEELFMVVNEAFGWA